MLNTFEQFVQSETEAIGRQALYRAQNLAQFEANRGQIELALDAFNHVALDYPGHYSWAYMSGDSLYVTVSSLKSFGEVAPYLRAIRQALPDAKLEKRLQQELQYECRVGPFFMTFQVSHSEATCRKVQVGVETKEVPVYKIVCDEGTDGDKVPEFDLSNNPGNGGI